MTARLMLAFALLASPALADTYVVSRGGGGDFTDLQVAIDSVNPGDTLLIRGTQAHNGGPYGAPPFTVTKSLTIRGAGKNAAIEGGGGQSGDGTALIVDAGPGSTVAIEGLRIDGADCEAYGFDGADGVRVLLCGNLAIARCTISAGDMFIVNAQD